jgi:hypothetical protein
MKGMTSTPIARQAVSRWLHKEPGKRQEPKHGIALLIERAVAQLQSEGQPST